MKSVHGWQGICVGAQDMTELSAQCWMQQTVKAFYHEGDKGSQRF
jgi:hypothetical protein